MAVPFVFYWFFCKNRAFLLALFIKLYYNKSDALGEEAC